MVSKICIESKSFETFSKASEISTLARIVAVHPGPPNHSETKFAIVTTPSHMPLELDCFEKDQQWPT